MIGRILIEIVLAVITMFAAGLFWQFIKRKRFLVAALKNEAFLTTAFANANFDTPSPRIEPYANEFPTG